MLIDIFIDLNVVFFAIFTAIVWMPKFSGLAQIWFIYGIVLFLVIYTQNPADLLARTGQSCHLVLQGDAHRHLIHAGFVCN